MRDMWRQIVGGDLIRLRLARGKEMMPRGSYLRRLVAVLTSLALLLTTATALAADEATTTTQPSTTTTQPSTTTTQPSTTTTSPTTTTTVAQEEEQADEDDVRLLTPPSILFPLVGQFSFRDTWGAPRDGGRRQHKGTDIAVPKGTPVIAVADGTITRMTTGRLAGQYITLHHDDGWYSQYLHLNNDSPGTDDGEAVGFAEGIEVGMHVTAGTVIGFAGDSGNAETTTSHLHFELHQPDGVKINPYSSLIGADHLEDLDGTPQPAQTAGSTSTTPTPTPSTDNTVLVGHLDPDGTGFNAGIAAHDGYVYMGTWGRRGHCPGTGVRVMDVTDPTEPVSLSSFAGEDEFHGTRAETIWVGEVEGETFAGTMAVVGIRLCDSGWRTRGAAEFVGLALYDVTAPDDPQLLSQIHSGDRTQGVHHVTLQTSGDRRLAAVTVPHSLLHDPAETGDVRLYDLTDPFEPELLSDWDLRRDGPPAMAEELTDAVGEEALSGHSVSWLDSNHVVVAHSAAGMITLDVSDPTRPEYVSSATPYDVDELEEEHVYDRGHGHNAHSGWLYDGRVLVQDDQHLRLGAQGDGETAEWGQQTLYDFAVPGNPEPISTFATENSTAGADGEILRDGYYSAHHSVPFGADGELVTWFSDGVRVVDLTDPSDPTEVASFVPPPSRDPQGWWVAPDGTREFPMVWGATSEDELVYASDLNSGLWIFRVVTPTETPESIVPN